MSHLCFQMYFLIDDYYKDQLELIEMLNDSQKLMSLRQCDSVTKVL